jgi:hypothetical protein
MKKTTVKHPIPKPAYALRIVLEAKISSRVAKAILKNQTLRRPAEPIGFEILGESAKFDFTEASVLTLPKEKHNGNRS